MTCSRCAGLMVEDYGLELDLVEGERVFWAWRCINCGHIVEAVMEHNRSTASRAASGSADADQAAPLLRS